MQSLLDGDDLAVGLVIEAGKKRPLDVGFRAGAFCIWSCSGIRRLEEIIDDQDIGPEPCRCTPEGDSFSKAPPGGADLVDPGTALGNPCPGKECLVPVTLQDRTEVLRMLARQILRIACDQDAAARVVPEEPGRQGNGRTDRLEVARRDGDDQPLAPPLRRGIERGL